MLLSRIRFPFHHHINDPNNKNDNTEISFLLVVALSQDSTSHSGFVGHGKNHNNLKLCNRRKLSCPCYVVSSCRRRTYFRLCFGGPHKNYIFLRTSTEAEAAIFRYLPCNQPASHLHSPPPLVVIIGKVGSSKNYVVNYIIENS